MIALFRTIAAVGCTIVVSSCCFANSTTAPSDDAEKGRVRELIKHIKDEAYPGHGFNSPATKELIKLGRAALPDTVELMLNDDELTRMFAESVLVNVMMNMNGFKLGHGWPSAEQEQRYKDLWHKLGNLSWDAPAESRRKAVELWREWLRIIA